MIGHRSEGQTPAAADGGRSLVVGLYCVGWPPSAFANGIVTYVDAIAEGMRALGHRPVILAGTVSEPAERREGIPVIDLKPLETPDVPARLADALASRLRGRSGWVSPRWIGRALRKVARRTDGRPRLDVLEVEESFGLPGMVAGRVRVPVVARLHGPWFLTGPYQGVDPSAPEFEARVRAEGRGLRRSAAITAPSRDVLARSAAHYGLPAGSGEVIPNPVRPVPPEARWRAEGCEPEHILFVGRFDRCKGGDTVIDAFALLLRDRPGARLTIIGPDGNPARNGIGETLPEYAAARLPGALEDGRIRWLGRRPPSEIAALRARAAVTVVASRYETFSLTAAEAMAAGCPLVATRVGGAAELFEHGTHGLHVEPDDPAALASAVSSVLADPAGAEAMGRSALEHSLKRFAPEAVAARTIDVYRRVLGLGGGSRLAAREGMRP
ncbi:glycosyltransferase family 4 protein [Tautonia sociabilis]|uniref:Glycosyltransferase family 1 protein n=1 Tax=Tautonia sociabilis TaxID=2080755 RepID=A0A432MFH9_9BACT|nr:glycosyltransferase family 4 protein [Tautonia sociabilis]RUL84932.1 glycosyltransferase family 1 protein [Tautonia sociabilis]